MNIFRKLHDALYRNFVRGEYQDAVETWVGIYRCGDVPEYEDSRLEHWESEAKKFNIPIIPKAELKERARGNCE